MFSSDIFVGVAFIISYMEVPYSRASHLSPDFVHVLLSLDQFCTYINECLAPVNVTKLINFLPS